MTHELVLLKDDQTYIYRFDSSSETLRGAAFDAIMVDAEDPNTNITIEDAVALIISAIQCKC